MIYHFNSDLLHLGTWYSKVLCESKEVRFMTVHSQWSHKGDRQITSKMHPRDFWACSEFPFDSSKVCQEYFLSLSKRPNIFDTFEVALGWFKETHGSSFPGTSNQNVIFNFELVCSKSSWTNESSISWFLYVRRYLVGIQPWSKFTLITVQFLVITSSWGLKSSEVLFVRTNWPSGLDRSSSR